MSLEVKRLNSIIRDLEACLYELEVLLRETEAINVALVHHAGGTVTLNKADREAIGDYARLTIRFQKELDLVEIELVKRDDRKADVAPLPSNVVQMPAPAILPKQETDGSNEG